MVQRIRDFAEACRHNVGVSVRCGCGKKAVFPARNFSGYVRPGADLEKLTFRCSWCRGTATARYVLLEVVEREALAQWRPPAGMRRPGIL